MSIFKYTNYKTYFKDLIKSKDSNGRGEFRKISEYVNIHPTFVSQVFSGEKHFSPEQALQVADYFGLGKSESKFLVILIEIDRAGSNDLKEHFVEIRNDMQKKSQDLANRIEKKYTLSDSERAVFYSSWVYSAVHLMTSLDRDVDFNFICHRLKISPDKARQVLEFLKKNNLVIEEKGLLKNGLGSNHLEKKSPFIFKHHTNWRIKSIEKIENLTEQEFMFSGNLSLSKDDFLKLREEIMVFIQNFLKTVNASPAEDIAQLNLDFFWV